MSDIKRIKQLAGLAPLVEAWDSDDYDRYMNVGSDNMKDSPSASGGFDDETGAMSPAERRLAMSAQRALAQKGINVDDNSAEGEIPTDIPTAPVKMTAGAPAARKGPPRRLTKSTLDPEIARQLAGEDEPAEYNFAAAGPATVVGGEVPPAGETPVLARGEKSAKARQYLELNKGASRKEFMQFAARELGMGNHYSNTLYYALKKRMGAEAVPGAANIPADMPMEFYVVQNTTNQRVLAEKTAYDVPTWTTFDKIGMFEPMIFESEIHAKKAIAALAKYGFTKVKLVKEVF